MKYLLLFCLSYLLVQPLQSQNEAELLNNELRFSQLGNLLDTATYGFDSLYINKEQNSLTATNKKLSLSGNSFTSTLTPDNLVFKGGFLPELSTEYEKFYLRFIENGFDSNGTEIESAWNLGSYPSSSDRRSFSIYETVETGFFGEIGFFNALTIQHIEDSGGNKIGIGTTSPKTKLHLSSGDIYLQGSEGGIIMKSPNGNCWKLSVSDAGAPVFSSTPCP